MNQSFDDYGLWATICYESDNILYQFLWATPNASSLLRVLFNFSFVLFRTLRWAISTPIAKDVVGSGSVKR